VKIRHGLRGAGLIVVSFAGLVLISGPTAAAAPAAEAVSTQIADISCAIDFVPQPRVDGFTVHSTGVVTCDTVATRIEGSMDFYRDGEVVGNTEFLRLDAPDATAHVEMPCVAGTYSATMNAHWVSASGFEGEDSQDSATISITC